MMTDIGQLAHILEMAFKAMEHTISRIYTTSTILPPMLSLGIFWWEAGVALHDHVEQNLLQRGLVGDISMALLALRHDCVTST